MEHSLELWYMFNRSRETNDRRCLGKVHRERSESASNKNARKHYVLNDFRCSTCNFSGVPLLSDTSPALSSHISVESSHSHSKQRRICAAQRALLTNASIWSYIVVGKSIAMSIDVRRMD
jgi:hypothetical protein